MTPEQSKELRTLMRTLRSHARQINQINRQAKRNSREIPEFTQVGWQRGTVRTIELQLRKEKRALNQLLARCKKSVHRIERAADAEIKGVELASVAILKRIDVLNGRLSS